jgi:hypothetical protein
MKSRIIWKYHIDLDFAFKVNCSKLLEYTESQNFLDPNFEKPKPYLKHGFKNTDLGLIKHTNS